MSFSNALEEAVLEWMFKGQSFGTPPTTIYVSLHSTQPNDTASAGSEISGGGYARASLSADTATTAANWTAIAASTSGSSQIVRNNQNITFPTATAAWPTATHFGLWDGSNTFLAWGTIAGGMTVQSGDTVVLTPQDLEVSAD